jgi:hypothetical protein
MRKLTSMRGRSPVFFRTDLAMQPPTLSDRQRRLLRLRHCFPDQHAPRTLRQPVYSHLPPPRRLYRYGNDCASAIKDADAVVGSPEPGGRVLKAFATTLNCSRSNRTRMGCYYACHTGHMDETPSSLRGARDFYNRLISCDLNHIPYYRLVTRSHSSARPPREFLIT